MSFQEKLEQGLPLVTVELSPPKGTDFSRVIARVSELKGKVDAINVPDCQRSILKMSSMAMSKLIQDQTGVETVWQLTCRDRNLIALQADLMGAYALGLKTVLALTGDPVQVGDQKDVAKQVFHLDSVRLLDLIQSMNLGNDATGQALKNGGTGFLLGGALNPLKISNHAQQMRIRQKLERGLVFFQTQPVYHREPVERMWEIIQPIVDDLGCPMPRVMLGIIPPKNATSARFMNQNVAGINIPESFIEILERSPTPYLESIRFCAEIVHDLKSLCDGFHFMPVGMESKAALLLDECFTAVS
ncbi:MAG: methylenetetrahydrofolate reductase [Cyanobacteria bacterium]|nr:methylenetetrahydrofolate reductase [Cyanobacteriota bacterium]